MEYIEVWEDIYTMDVVWAITMVADGWFVTTTVFWKDMQVLADIEEEWEYWHDWLIWYQWKEDLKTYLEKKV